MRVAGWFRQSSRSRASVAQTSAEARAAHQAKSHSESITRYLARVCRDLLMLHTGFILRLPVPTDYWKS